MTKCVICNEPLTRKQKKYCSKKCSAKAFNAKKAEAKRQELEKFRETPTKSQYRAELWQKYQEGIELDRSEKMAAWQTLEQYRQLHPKTDEENVWTPERMRQWMK